MEIEPGSPEWTIAWTLKQRARSLLGPKADRVPANLIAQEITEALKKSNWRLIRIPPERPAPGNTDGMREVFLRQRQEEREAFEDLLTALLRVWHLHR
jgi:hypothetical protein